MAAASTAASQQVIRTGAGARFAIYTILALFCLYCVVFYNTAALKWVAITFVVAIAYYFVWGNKRIRPFNEEFGVLDELN